MAEHVRDDQNRRSARTIGLRIAALTGTVLAAGAFAATGSVEETGQPVDDVVSTGIWPMGSTCCPEETE